jgi:hypothetical protein
MSLLFDISPDEVPDQKKKKAGRAKAAEKTEVPAEEGPAYLRPQEIIGRSAGDYTCDCESTHFDIIDDFRGEWLLECCMCGLKLRVPALKTESAEHEFVFFDGRHSGMTIAQVSETPQGIAYIRWCAEKHKSGVVKEACKAWASSVGYSAPQR